MAQVTVSQVPDELSLVYAGRLVPKERPRRGKSGQFYTPRQTVLAEEDLGWQMRALRPRGWRLDRFYSLECRFFLQTHVRSDGDNLVKTVKDAGNKILWDDDALVVEHHVYVVRGDPDPRAEIRVREVPCPHFPAKTKRKASP